MPMPTGDPIPDPRDSVTGSFEGPPHTRPQSPLHPVSLLAGAGSAAVAAVIGGRLGLSGTVVGAAVGSIVATIAGAAIKHSAHRSGAAVVGLARRRRSGTQASAATAGSPPWRTWLRRGAMVGAGFALGIVGLLAVQLGLGRSLSPGSGQLQEAATHVVAPTTVLHRASPHPSSPAPSAATQTTPARSASPSPTSTPSATAMPTADPIKAPSASGTPTPSSTPSAATLQPTTAAAS